MSNPIFTKRFAMLAAVIESIANATDLSEADVLRIAARRLAREWEETGVLRLLESGKQITHSIVKRTRAENRLGEMEAEFDLPPGEVNQRIAEYFIKEIKGSDMWSIGSLIRGPLGCLERHTGPGMRLRDKWREEDGDGNFYTGAKPHPLFGEGKPRNENRAA